MTIEEIEVACAAGQPMDFRRHSLELPETTIRERFFPYGFPVDLQSNSAEVMEMYRKAWGMFPSRYETTPIKVTITVIPSDSDICPSTPTFHIMLPMMVSVADANNCTTIDLEHGSTNVVINEAAIRHPLYASYHFIEFAASCHIANSLVTPIHSGCVEWAGSGILLCGDSGAGKSTLSFACARAGLGYVSDDATFLLQSADGRTVVGNPHKVRLRPEAEQFFPEMRGLPLTPRAIGKPSVEIASNEGIRKMHETRIDHIVFLNRRKGRKELVPYSKEVARQFMRQTAWGMPAQQEEKYRNIDRLLNAQVHEMHYSDLQWAIDRLKRLAEESC